MHDAPHIGTKPLPPCWQPHWPALPLPLRSVLLLDEERVGIGRIEEVFGPVMLPFYALRWAPGPGGAARVQPGGLQAGALVSVLPGHVDHIKPEELVRAAGSKEQCASAGLACGLMQAPSVPVEPESRLQRTFKADLPLHHAARPLRPRSRLHA